MSIYTYTTLDNPAATATTQPLGINDAGQVVGIYQAPIIGSTYYGFLYSGGSYTTLSDPSSTALNGSGTFAYGINASGQIVGYYLGHNGHNEGFLYSGGSYTTLDDPLATISTEPAGINASGRIVGSFRDNDGYHGFLYSGGIYTTLNGPLTNSLTHAQGINAAGQVVGWYANASGTHGFLYNPSGGTYTTLDNPLATSGTFAYGINDTGQIVGSYQDSSGRYHGFLYTSGTYIALDDPWPLRAVAAAAPLHMASIIQARLSANISTTPVGTASSLPSGRTRRRRPAPPPT
jgi:probable HAF family extracellular repeat protein